jgi:hypothetical protein
MLPPANERRPRDSLEYRDENIDSRRPPSADRPYGRVAPREVDTPLKTESPNLAKTAEDPKVSPLAAKHKENTDPGRDPLSNGSRARPPMDSKIGTPPAYGYGRERPEHPDIYRDGGEFGRGPYSTFEGRGRGIDPRDVRGEPPYDKPRDPRDPYYASPPYPAVPPSEYRGRDAYPPRAQPPLDYARGVPYDERYPRDMDLDLPRGREGYRDLPTRPQEYGQKRKFDTPDYMDPYLDDYRVHSLSYDD